VVWRHSIASLVAQPFAALYDGGDVPPDPRPAYSVAQARRKQGNFSEALAEIQKQLDVFPADLEGHMLMAEIHARDLKDLASAEQTLQNFVAQPNHAPANVAYVLYSMADWYLEARDREGALRCLEQIQQLLPNSEFALGAANRIAHLGSADAILAARQAKGYAVKEGVRNLGLMQNPEDLTPVGKDPAQLAGEYVKHLEEHPLDTEAREKLAVIYCDHYGRLDLATDQLEQMISQPHQPQRMIAHWLNLLTDLQIRSGANYETAKQTLERIVELAPNVAAAQMARNRIDRLKLELKTQQKSEAKQLGTYEQNIGLKQGLPRGN
jgi:tetratricopeptide (TPR) repeat protein